MKLSMSCHENYLGKCLQQGILWTRLGFSTILSSQWRLFESFKRQRTTKCISLTIDSRNEKKRNFRCETCDKYFSSSSSLWQHKKTHLDDRQTYKCQMCQKTFISESNLDVHVKIIHMGHRIKCNECSRIFCYKNGFDRHVSSVHKDMKDKYPKYSIQMPKENTHPI